ncbi:hypothetical protein [Enorma sp.]|uniref:hypothetical protein n=1 Tax=Enorma sp. TaxID=1920692 RepID=UPI0025C09FE6|nr:hypothetical protein [Enorma sp.]
MAETEKVEIMNFDQEGYLEDGKALVETGKKMAAMADQIADEGYDAIFLMGVGGTWDELMQLEYLMNKFGDKDLEVYLIHAAEWNVSGHKRMTEKSVVLTASESGTTPEVLEAVKKMKEMTSGRTSSTSARSSSPRPRSSPRGTRSRPTPCSSAPARSGARRSCSPCASSRRCSGSAPATSPRPTSSTAPSSSWSRASRCSCSRARTSAASSTSASRPSSHYHQFDY